MNAAVTTGLASAFHVPSGRSFRVGTENSVVPVGATRAASGSGNTPAEPWPTDNADHQVLVRMPAVEPTQPTGATGRSTDGGSSAIPFTIGGTDRSGPGDGAGVVVAQAKCCVVFGFDDSIQTPIPAPPANSMVASPAVQTLPIMT